MKARVLDVTCSVCAEPVRLHGVVVSTEEELDAIVLPEHSLFSRHCPSCSCLAGECPGSGEAISEGPLSVLRLDD